MVKEERRGHCVPFLIAGRSVLIYRQSDALETSLWPFHLKLFFACRWVKLPLTGYKKQDTVTLAPNPVA